MKSDKKSVAHKIKVARGQLDGVLKMIEEDRYCVDVSTQLLAAQALLKSANQQILEGHIRHCVSQAIASGDPGEKIEEALMILEKMAKV
ncbi:MAG: metal-sensing transcriptional repressor [Firmicutes bacterium]|nr:metal-sensing transcriptional repressor [Bacillota bacterium]